MRYFQNMVRELRIMPEAEADLDEIYHYILKRFLAPQAAETTMTNIRLAMEQFLEVPDLGIDVTERIGRQFSKDHTLRMTLAGNYLVFYIVNDKAIAVLRVLYQNRNWVEVFR
ncbi:type II toxin-antitoxin system RelE/ParE family toxin [Streptococcus sp. S784/96/1]|uniref:type II toxin-antitoxin system RelE/ParE family toxin n=1 Tax=Streptococcus sp. S784/96/1 TaxID=2653499 RepID=UPI001EE3AB53|nr:type II toxin-antitoxin system RelE/ParE family toxin [Streptococcus sp. S784/96/1]